MVVGGVLILLPDGGAVGHVVVNLYLVGDHRILIVVGTVIGAIWVGHYLRSGMNRAQEAREAPAVAPAPPAATAASR